MSENKKRSFFDRLTGANQIEEEEERPDTRKNALKGIKDDKTGEKNWMEEENDEAELTVDVYQTANDIVIQTMVAGVKPDDLDLTIARDMITIRGKREEHRNIDEENYFTKELYWGKFSRTISLPQEVEPEEVEATEKHGLLTIKIQKVDKEKKNSIRVKSI
ncbi:MAG: Hsp20/alpha crystallin family protein [Candidatus Pacebacteria bacterium]|nr:Hsp20/alpha crystallin family protein [Candidatus Paceibacterota bacterium]